MRAAQLWDQTDRLTNADALIAVLWQSAYMRGLGACLGCGTFAGRSSGCAISAVNIVFHYLKYCPFPSLGPIP